MKYRRKVGIYRFTEGWRYGQMKVSSVGVNFLKKECKTCHYKTLRQQTSLQKAVYSNVCRNNNSQLVQKVNPSTPSVALLGKQNTQHYSGAELYAAMAVHNAGSHPVNISKQKNITAERTLNCFPCLSLWDSILLF